MTYLPSKPLELPRPCGASSETERCRSATLFIEPVHRNTIFDLTTERALLRASINRTPVTRREARSNSSDSAIASVMTVSRPVALAAGSVELRLLKYAPNEQP